MSVKRTQPSLLLALLTLPLLATGPCLTMVQRSLIQGFFNAVRPIVVEQVREELGLPTDFQAGDATESTSPAD